MNSTKIMLLGALIVLLGLAVNSVVSQFVVIRIFGLNPASSLAYIAVALYVVGFVIGVFGFFKR